MPEDEKQKKKHSGDLSLTTMLAASTAGAVATAAVSGVGIAGTLLGGAVFPILLTLAREMVLRAADRAKDVATPTRPITARGRGGDEPTAVMTNAGEDATAVMPNPGETGPEPELADPPPPQKSLLRRIRWRSVAVTGGAAVAVVVAVYTASDLVLGESPVADRGSTFFSRPAPADPDSDEEDAAPEAGTTTRQEPAAPPAETTTGAEDEEAPATTEGDGTTAPSDEAPPDATTQAPSDGAQPPAPEASAGTVPDPTQVPLP